MLQDFQRYRALCLWERLLLLFEVILIGHFRLYKFDIEKEQKSLSQAKCPISVTVL